MKLNNLSKNYCRKKTLRLILKKKLLTKCKFYYKIKIKMNDLKYDNNWMNNIKKKVNIKNNNIRKNYSMNNKYQSIIWRQLMKDK